MEEERGPQSKLVARFPPFRFGNWEHCAYCGAVPNCIDHAIPMAYASKLLTREMNRSFAPQTPACTWCNSRLSDKVFFSFEERCKFITAKLHAKSSRISADWGREEILQLDDALRNFVTIKQAERANFIRRWQWFRTDPYYLNLENLLYEPLLERNKRYTHPLYEQFFRTTIESVKSCLDSRKNVQGDS